MRKKLPRSHRASRGLKARVSRLLIREVLFEVLGLFGAFVAVLSARFFVVRYSAATNDLFAMSTSVTVTVGALLIPAFIQLKERASHRKELIELVKLKHVSFFNRVNEDVARLIKKD